MNKPSGAFSEVKELLVQKFPWMNELLNEKSKKTVEEYITEKHTSRRIETWDNPKDVTDVISSHTKRIYSENLAEKVRKRLERFPAVNTANHAGILTDPPTSHWPILDSFGDSEVNIVLTCGAIPMNTSTKPMSLITKEGKINIFPNKYRHMITHVAGSFTKEMIGQARSSLTQKVQGADSRIDFSKGTIKGVNRILDFCERKEVLSQKHFVDQTSMINSLIWKELFTAEAYKNVPDLVCLELEDISSGLLEKDLNDSGSLISKILFDSQTREAIIKNLNNIRGCWNNEVLSKLLDPSLGPKEREELAKNSMTQFFWGIEKDRTSYPLILVEENKKPFLRRADILKITPDIPLSPDSIIPLIKSKKLMPSLFTTFTVLQFARGIRCLGAFNQEDYLREMESGLIKSLNEMQANKDLAYLFTLPIINKTKNNNLSYAGPIEIMARGGLTKTEIQKLKSTPLYISGIISGVSLAQFLLRDKLDNDTLSKAQEEVLAHCSKYLIVI